jgi:hypothetical protein
MGLVKIGHTVYAPCSNGDGTGFVLPITVVSDKNWTPPADGENIRYVRRWWLNNMIKAQQVKVFQSRRKALMSLKLKGVNIC